MSGQGPGVPTDIIPRSASLKDFAAIAQSILDAVPVGFCVCRADTSLVRYNRRAVELWGDALPLDDPQVFASSAFRRYRADGEPLNFDSSPVVRALHSGERVIGAELVIGRPDGSRVPVLMNVAPLEDSRGRVEGAICSFQELTERKRAEEALRASEAELQSVINRTPFMLVRCSRDLRYRFVSDAYAQLLAQPRDNILGKSIADILGEKGLATLRPYTEKVLRGQAVDFECELTFRTPARAPCISPIGPSVTSKEMSAAGSHRCSMSPSFTPARRRGGSSRASSNRRMMPSSAWTSTEPS